jgi:phospholipid-binding lipoprotein MlaA
MKKVILIIGLLGGCGDSSPSFVSNPKQDVVVNKDPLEDFNRVMFSVNELLEVIIIRPIAMFYQTLIPPIIRHGVSNVFYNLTLPLQSMAYIVAGDSKRAGEEFLRFGANSTFGVLGIFDASSVVELKKAIPYDLDKAFDAWGFPEGPYIVFPVLGNMTFRHFFTFMLGGVVDPANITLDAYIDPYASWYRTAIFYELIYADFFDKYGSDTTLRDKLDFYISVREAYFQQRKQGEKEIYVSPKISMED